MNRRVIDWITNACFRVQVFLNGVPGLLDALLTAAVVLASTFEWNAVIFPSGKNLIGIYLFYFSVEEGNIDETDRVIFIPA